MAIPQKLNLALAELPDDALVPVRAVAAMVGISVATVHRWVRAGLLPPPVIRAGMPRPSGHLAVTRWRLGQIRAWLAERSSGDAA